MPSTRRGAKTVAGSRGGLDAIRAAKELIRVDGQIQIRVSAARKGLYTVAAKRAGLTLSAWVLRQLDAAISR